MTLLAALAAALGLTVGGVPGLARGPVITQVTPAGATIAWRLDAPAPQTLQIGRQTLPAGREANAVVRVRGLAPGRRYRYAVRAGGRVVARGSLRTAPLPGGRFRAVVYGDYGAGTAEQRAVARLATSWQPDLFVAPGDHVYPAAFDALLEHNLFRPMRPLLRRAAFIPALGNHEQYAFGSRSFLNAFELRGAERWYLERYGPAAFLVLDSNTDLAPGTRQGRFLARAARQAARSCFRFAVVHHPPFAPHEEGIAPHLRRHLLPLLQRHGFQAIFLGHVHAYERNVPVGGITHVTVGTGGAEINEGGESTRPLAASVYGRFGALRLDVGPRTARGDFVTVDGQVRDRFTLRCRPAGG
jgi:hypothetical protein